MGVLTEHRRQGVLTAVLPQDLFAASYGESRLCIVASLRGKYAGVGK